MIRRVPGGSVLHPRINVDPATPHKGQSPVNLAATTGKLAANVEASLKNEAGANVGYVVPAPLEGMSEDDLSGLKGDVQGLKGRTALVPGMQRGWQDSGVGPGSSNWRVQRIGLQPPESVVNLRSAASQDILAACGVPVELFSGDADGTARREAWRVFLHGSVQGVADTVASEFSAELELPVRIDFRRLFASDIQGRGRAFASLTKGGMDTERAARAVGID